MAFIIVEPAGRDDQVEILVVDDDDRYDFSRTHRGAPNAQIIEIIREYASKHNNPPIVVKIDNMKCAQIANDLRDYPRMVKARG